ncbi:MAG: hypothetical protein SH820_12315 [Xanthomonadales bacterium]|nr:hypothetical protein [Xanthomonadales bacterium]
MNLSLYLLLAPSADTEQPSGVDQQPRQKAKQIVGPKARQDFVPVYNPLQTSRAGSRRLVQATRKPILAPASKATTFQSIGFGMSVVAHALGFLTITAAALLLLRVAEMSLI